MEKVSPTPRPPVPPSDSKLRNNVTGPSAPARNWRNRVPRPGVRVVVRSGLGPNLATGLVNLSEEGAAVLVNALARVGEEVEVVFRQPNGMALKMEADVRWCNAIGCGQYEAGVQFRRRLSAEELLDLCY
jgi:PilZ domain